MSNGKSARDEASRLVCNAIVLFDVSISLNVVSSDNSIAPVQFVDAISLSLLIKRILHTGDGSSKSNWPSWGMINMTDGKMRRTDRPDSLVRPLELMR